MAHSISPSIYPVLLGFKDENIDRDCGTGVDYRTSKIGGKEVRNLSPIITFLLSQPFI
jgi:hypothetical protein